MSFAGAAQEDGGLLHLPIWLPSGLAEGLQVGAKLLGGLVGGALLGAVHGGVLQGAVGVFVGVVGDGVGLHLPKVEVNLAVLGVLANVLASVGVSRIFVRGVFL